MRRFIQPLLLIGMFLLQAGSLPAQIPHTPASPAFYILEDTARTIGVKDAWQLYKTGRFASLQNLYINPGFTRSVFWVALTPGHLSATVQQVLLVNNAHINYLEWYGIGADTTIKALAFTGDAWPFAHRPLPYNYFAFPLQPAAAVYLLKIDKHFESLQAPLQLLTMEALVQQGAQESMVNGLLSGVILLMVLFGIFLFLTTRDQLYLWYALYVLAISLWIWTDKGVGFQYIWPASTYFPSRARPLFLVITMLTSIQFLQLFIQQGKASLCYRPFKAIQALCAITILLVLWPFDYTIVGSFMLWFLRIITWMAAIYVLLFIVSLIEKIRRHNRQALVYLVATLVLMLFSGAESLSHFGRVTLPPYLAKFGMLTGVVLEMIIIMFGMADRFNQYRKDREALMAEKNLRQKELTDTIITIQENERKVLADQLHDEIGSLLSLASLNLGAAQEKAGLEGAAKISQASEVVQMVTHTVRNISHQLTPLAIEKYGFRHAIEHLVSMANATGKIKIELVLLGMDSGKELTVNFRNTLYRIIQELAQNVIKHAAATHVLIQLIEHEQSISLLVEDDGVGMGEAVENNGLLLRSVQSKVAYLEAVMVVETGHNSGTMINIDIPLFPDKSFISYAVSPDNSR